MHFNLNTAELKLDTEEDSTLDAAKRLTKMIQECVQEECTGNDVLVVIPFDESHQLTEGNGWKFHAIRRALRIVLEEPIFALFLSTTGKAVAFTPSASKDLSGRVQKGELLLATPFTELGFEQPAGLLRSPMPPKIKDVSTEQFMSYLGRPL